ncbi:hypothetical protein KC949_02265 [Candidatus Saccharibacteria bacterium]|nr:hypothetical protein [Candidatus Saccharibacteria bacterium]
MINLLPDSKKADIRAGRTNVILLRYIALTGVVLSLLALVCTGFFIILNDTRNHSIELAKSNAQSSIQFAKVHQQATEYQQNLSVAKQIIGQSINYTDIVMDITKLVPKGVVLDSITLSPDNLNGRTVFTAHATDSEAAMALKNNFADSKKILGKEIFSDVYFQNLTQSDTSASVSGNTLSKYPVLVSLSVQLNIKAAK